MIAVGKWNYQITQERDNDWQWSLAYDYNNEFMIESRSFKTFKACQKDAIKNMKKMSLQFNKLITRATNGPTLNKYN